MRALYFALAAAFSVAAIIVQLVNLTPFLAILALAVAGVFLLLGFRVTAENRVAAPVVLDEEKRATLRALKAEGNHGGAIRQVQLWFRDATPEEARRVVRELD